MVTEVDPSAKLYSVRFRRKDLRQNQRDDKLEVLRQIIGLSDTNNVLDLVKESERTRDLRNKSNTRLYQDDQTIVDLNLFRIPSIHIKLTRDQVSRLRKHPDIRFVQEAQPTKAAAETIPWGITRVGGGTEINAATHHRGYGVKCCIIDTGINYNHVDLKPNYYGGVTFIAGTSTPMDDQTGVYHGTHVSGTVAAAVNNSDVVGVAPETWLYSAKVLDKGGAGNTALTTQGIVWATTNKMDVMNISIGSGSVDPPPFKDEDDAVAAAYNAGIFVCAAAGNSGVYTWSYPAACAGAYCVGATDETDIKASFSNWYKVGYVDFAAPGVNINSDSGGVTTGTHSLNGTSMATPHVTGIYTIGMANYRFSPCDTSIYPANQKRMIHIIAAMIKSCDTLGQTTPGVANDKYGFGMPQISTLLDLLMPP